MSDGLLLAILMVVLPYTVYALAGQEHLGAVCSFNSCRQGVFWCRLSCSCRQGALFPFAALARTGKERFSVAFYAHADKELWLSPFRLVRTRSFGVAFYARADQELSAMQFRLVQARSLVSYNLGSCGQ
ncbi:hypothetical protein ACFX13_027888 [Malus domestica]